MERAKFYVLLFAVVRFAKLFRDAYTCDKTEAGCLRLWDLQQQIVPIFACFSVAVMEWLLQLLTPPDSDLRPDELKFRQAQKVIQISLTQAPPPPNGGLPSHMAFQAQTTHATQQYNQYNEFIGVNEPSHTTTGTSQVACNNNSTSSGSRTSNNNNSNATSNRTSNKENHANNNTPNTENNGFQDPNKPQQREIMIQLKRKINSDSIHTGDHKHCVASRGGMVGTPLTSDTQTHLRHGSAPKMSHMMSEQQWKGLVEESNQYCEQNGLQEHITPVEQETGAHWHPNPKQQPQVFVPNQGQDGLIRVNQPPPNHQNQHPNQQQQQNDQSAQHGYNGPPQGPNGYQRHPQQPSQGKLKNPMFVV